MAAHGSLEPMVLVRIQAEERVPHDPERWTASVNPLPSVVRESRPLAFTRCSWSCGTINVGLGISKKERSAYNRRCAPLFFANSQLISTYRSNSICNRSSLFAHGFFAPNATSTTLSSRWWALRRSAGMKPGSYRSANDWPSC